jgi:hypothetical protein
MMRLACLRLGRLVGDGDLDLHPWLNRDGSDLLDDVRGRVEVDDALVDAHLKPVPRLGTLTTGCHASRDAKHLRRQTDGARHLALKTLVLCRALEIRAHLLEGRHVAGRQRNAASVKAVSDNQLGGDCT